ncbi:acyl-CoA dehydrogenase family protein [Niveispirillum sp.]|uniref:acyl-CoA dehydrogenase family protein n=1 Tax=Niveispirillum sp. TaxID=1917217 RepID=UPI001B76B65F|nr:acyl-CoA dehydrogenase family protein [Niveispirillum sp.]MBP7337398.1 acyl-CoA/acyl-ACP dehydrogenase [Niveispirillum sp.]
MSEDLTIDIAELRDNVRQVLAGRSNLQAVRAMAEAGGGIDRALWAEMAGLGWMGLAVAEDQGGLGLGLGELAVLYDGLGRHLARVPFLSTMLAAQALERAGDAAQKQRWLPAIAAGELAVSMVLPEGPELPALAADGTLTGVADHMPFADGAGLLAVPVRLAGGGQTALALLPPGEAGISITRKAAIDLTRDLCAVRIDGVRVAADRLLPLTSAQWEGLRDHACVALACDAMGGALHILERTADYMSTRVQFDRPIGSFQALKHRAATWKIWQEAATALAFNAAAQVAAGLPDAGAAASAAKFYACDAYAAIAGDAVQLHGGIGFTWEHECHLFLKRAKLNQALFGGSAFHKDRVAGLLFAAA